MNTFVVPKEGLGPVLVFLDPTVKANIDAH